jgi:murein DD-endopeptidase MepM/ murein hydrolase activator NlpD
MVSPQTRVPTAAARRRPALLPALAVCGPLALLPALAPALHAQVADSSRLVAMPRPAGRARSELASVGRVTRLRDGTLRQTFTLKDVGRAYLPNARDLRPIYRGPVTPVPSGYGRYCSIVYGGGRWAVAALPAPDSDPCAQLRTTSPGGTIARAGLWHTQGDNNVMVRCRNDLRIYRAPGGTAQDTAYADALGKQDCVFVIAPAKLPIFGLPYGKTTSTQTDPNADVTFGRGFDYNLYNVPIDVAMFGHTLASGTTTAIWVDRTGRQTDYATVDGNGNPARADGEGAYDLLMPAGKPLLAVADGIVRGARWRDVSQFGCGPDLQGEIYIEHQVGSGEYAERFISYYAHGSKHDVQDGQTVRRGDKIGEVGNTGCSGGNHLHLGVARTTNLSGRRWYVFALTPGGYGINGIHGVIDPFGWAAPAHIDPWAWMALGERNDGIMGPIRDPGAFSIDLWIGARPPSTR